MTRRAPVCLLVALAAATIAPAAETCELKLKYPPGTVYQITRMNTQQSMSMSQQPGRTMNTRVQQLMVMKRVISQPDEKGNKTLTVTFERVVQKVTVPGVINASYDSAQPAAGQNARLAQALQPMLKTRMTATINAKGEIVDFKGADQLQGQTGGKSPLNNDQLKQMISASAQMLPDKPVAVGESWKVQQKLDSPMGKLTLDYDVRLKEVKQQGGQDVAVLQFKGTGKGQPGQVQQMGPIQAKTVSSELKQNGTVHFLIQRGDQGKMIMQQTVKMVMAMDNPNGPQAQTMQMTTDQQMQISMTVLTERDPQAEDKQAVEITGQAPPNAAPATQPAGK